MVILIVGILAAVAIPLMQGRIDKAKWSEANATAGTIRTAVRAYAAETSVSTAKVRLKEKLLVTLQHKCYWVSIRSDLTGTYFDPGCYTITSVDAQPVLLQSQ